MLKNENIEPLNHKKGFIIDKCNRGRHKKIFQIFEYRCIYNIKFKNIGNNELIILSISDKNMELHELKKKRKILDKEVLYLIK